MSYHLNGLGQTGSIVTLWSGSAQLREFQSLLRSRGEIGVVDGRVDLNGATHRAVLSYASAMGLPASQVAVNNGSITMPQSLLSAIQRGAPGSGTDVIADLARGGSSSATTSYSKEPGASSSDAKVTLPGIGPVSIPGSGSTPSWVIPAAVGGVALVGIVAIAATMSRRQTPRAMPKAPPLPIAANWR